METGIPDAGPHDIGAEKSAGASAVDAVAGACRLVVDHFRSDSVVAAADESVIRLIRGFHTEADEAAVRAAAERFHVIAQAAGAAASVADIAAATIFAGVGRLFLKDIVKKPMETQAESLAANVLKPNDSLGALKRNLLPGLAFGAPAVGIAAVRPARRILTLIVKGAGWGGEKVARAIERIRKGKI